VDSLYHALGGFAIAFIRFTQWLCPFHKLGWLQGERYWDTGFVCWIVPCLVCGCLNDECDQWGRIENVDIKTSYWYVEGEHYSNRAVGGH